VLTPELVSVGFTGAFVALMGAANLGFVFLSFLLLLLLMMMMMMMMNERSKLTLSNKTNKTNKKNRIDVQPRTESSPIEGGRIAWPLLSDVLARREPRGNFYGT
jgi:Na+-transporting methylmalonyl-CoA/oxaloacetate decarboxylase gamma subunit